MQKIYFPLSIIKGWEVFYYDIPSEKEVIMSQRLTINQNNNPIYDIVYEQDFNSLAGELDAFDIKNKKLCNLT